MASSAPKWPVPPAFRGAFRALICCLLVATAPCAGAFAATGDVRAARDTAVLLARDGQYDAAIRQLEQLLHTYPAETGVRADLLVVLQWAGRSADAVRVAAGLDPERLADFELLAWARALRADRRASEALALLQPRLADPGRTADVHALYALLLSDLGRNAEAVTYIEPWIARAPASVEIAAATAFVLRGAGRPIDALAVAQDALKLEPEHRELRRQQVFALSDLGAARLAGDMATSSPGLFDSAEMNLIAGNTASQRLRWARGYPESSAPRQDLIDTAIATLESLASTAPPASRAQLRSRFDLVVAYRMRNRMSDVIRQYEALVDDDINLPVYVRHAAADAYLAERNAEQAAELYRGILRDQPSMASARLGLIYARIESEWFGGPLWVVDDLSATSPAFIGIDGTNQYVANWPRLNADLSAAMLQAYDRRLGDAQQRLELLAADAPASAQVRRPLSTVYRWRGWPERALAQIEIAQAYEPEIIAGRQELAAVLADLGRFAEADRAIEALYREFPENEAVVRQRTAWRDRDRWSMSMDAEYGDSNGFTGFGSYDRVVNTRLAAPVIAHRWQPYALHTWRDARYPEGTAAEQRVAAGLSWRDQRRHGYVELHGNTAGLTGAGVTAGYDWHRDDHWSFATRAESDSLDAPLRARREDVTGWKVEGAARWQAHESFSVRGGLSRLALSDGNVRWSTLLGVEHRLHANAGRLTTGSADLYASRASREGGLYFNPASDLALGYAVTHERLGWRRYERSFSQLFVVGVGGYWQESFGASPTGTLRYEHAWRLSRRWGLRYGAGFSSRVYDGDRETRIDGRLSFEGSF